MCVCVVAKVELRKWGRLWGHGAVIDQSDDREESSYII
jgi:hypothetical protein